jgi:hypothetical protein
VTRNRWVLAGAAAVLVAVATAGAVARTVANQPPPAAPVPPTTTATVQRGPLSATVSVEGTLTFRARSDGSPYLVVNRASGTFTALPAVGDKVECGDELYRVDDKPVLLLCGPIPAYRDLRDGDTGNDVRQLNANLHALGDDAGTGVVIDPNDTAFTEHTAKALQRLQDAKGALATGALGAADAVFLPEPVRIAKVTGQLGGSAQPGAAVLDATSDTLKVRVELEGSQPSEVKRGDHAQITLPGNTSAAGKVDLLGTVAQAPAGANGNPGTGPATLPASISLDDPQQARGLDQAPVQVEITTQGVDDALSVPVTAIVGRSGGGFAVEVVRDGGRSDLAAVTLGLFDTTAGRVQVEGDLREGDHVVVPTL